MATLRHRRLGDRLAESRSLGLYPYDAVFERAGPAHVRLDGRLCLMGSSYDYLSLIGHPAIEQAAIAAIRARGTGTGGVRLLTGTAPEHRELERCLAERYGTEDCVTFSSGYFANIAALAAFGGADVAAFVDSLSHRSILDACRLAGSRTFRFRHNDPGDLARLIERQGKSEAGIVAIESLYSMDGDVAPVAAIARIAHDFGLKLLVDDAHGLGVLDPPSRPAAGGGAPAAWTGALSKAVPSNGGFVATSFEAADRIRHMASPYIFSAAAAPSIVAAALAALAVIEAEPWRRAALRANIARFAELLPEAAAGHDPASPIFPIRFGSDEQALRAAASLRSQAIIATPIVSPAVGPSRPRLRLCINAAHRPEDLDRLAAAIRALDGIFPLRETADRR